MLFVFTDYSCPDPPQIRNGQCIRINATSANCTCDYNFQAANASPIQTINCDTNNDWETYPLCISNSKHHQETWFTISRGYSLFFVFLSVNTFKELILRKNYLSELPYWTTLCGCEQGQVCSSWTCFLTLELIN